MNDIKVYEVHRNSDLTEGRGRSVVESVHDNVKDAISASRGVDVQGSDGVVHEVTPYSSYEEYLEAFKKYGTQANLYVRSEAVYGPHYDNTLKRMIGGWIGDRGPRSEDPEWEMYRELHNRMQAKGYID